MLRVTLGPGDNVLACMAVEDARLWLDGSTQEQCAECDRLVWRAPGLPLAMMTAFGPVRAPVGAPVPNIVMCLRCAAMHSQLTGFGDLK